MNSTGIITINCGELDIDLDDFSDWIVENYFNSESSESKIYNNQFFLDWYIGVDDDTNSIMLKVNIVNLE